MTEYLLTIYSRDGRPGDTFAHAAINGIVARREVADHLGVRFADVTVTGRLA